MSNWIDVKILSSELKVLYLNFALYIYTHTQKTDIKKNEENLDAHMAIKKDLNFPLVFYCKQTCLDLNT